MLSYFNDFPSWSHTYVSVNFRANTPSLDSFTDNTHIYPQYSLVKKLAANAFVNSISMDTIHIVPSAVLDTLVFIALGHRVSQCPEGTEQSGLAVLRTRMYDHRGKAIQAIHRVLEDDNLRDTDYALSLVLMLLFGEVSDYLGTLVVLDIYYTADRMFIT